jgi:predicted MFS family arabinose efflux permease
MSKTHRFFIAAYIFINALIIVNAGFMMPLWSDFVKHIGGDIRTAGNAVLLFSIVIGGVTCIAGNIESRIKKDRFFMIASQAVMCVGYFGYFFVKHPYQLYMVQVVLGLGGAFQSPVLCSLYQKSIPQNKTSHYWGIWNGLYQVAMGIGALLGAYIVHHTGYFDMFGAMFAVSIACLFFVTYVVSGAGFVRMFGSSLRA